MSSSKLPRPIVICGPSGSGKSTLLRKIFQEFPETFAFCVSHTTRCPRDGEINGVDYHFISREEMEEMRKNNDFLESVEFGGNFYGTSKASIKDVQEKGKICILDVDIQGVEVFKTTDYNPIYIFIKPPNLEVLQSRLEKRNSETKDSLKLRMNRAQEEIDYANTEGNFDIVITNDNLRLAYKEFKDFILQEIKTQIANGVKI